VSINKYRENGKEEVKVDIVSTEEDFYAMYNEDLLVYSNQVLSTYNSTGKKTWNYTLDQMFTPNIYIKGKYMIVSNNTSGNIYMFESKKEILNKKIDGKTVGNWNRSQIVSKFLTSDGMSVFFYTYGNKPANNGQGIEKVSYGALSVDINGFKGPNTAGQDLFTFIIAKNGIYPHGTKTSLMDEKLDDGTIVRINSFPRMCNRNDCYGNCEACGAWVMYNENLDYMRCDNLSWNGKHSCK